MGRALRIGLYSPYFGSTVGGGERYLGETARALKDAFPAHSVELAGAAPIDRRRYEDALGLDLEGIGLVSTNPRPGPLRRLARVRALRALRNRAVGGQAAALSGRYDLFLLMSYRVTFASRARRSVILCQFPDEQPAGLDRFAEVICQSDYVRGWVRRRWGREARVVEPPIEIPGEEPSWEAKERVVLSVGRFAGEGHVKRHDVLVEAFRRLLDSGLAGWELHLAGSSHGDARSRAYLERVRRLAEGAPVHLHLDAPRDELAGLYRRASIYWHAAGYGSGEDPAAAEHFGMSTAEAMASGCVPVVIGMGGQPEIVEEGVTGRLWRTAAELEAATRALAGDAAARRRLGAAARASVSRFATPRFRERMAEALAPHVEAAQRG